MLKTLLKKNFIELFRSYFYNAKKNRMRSKGAVIGWMIFFFFLIYVVIGGSIGFMAFAMCLSFVETGMGWLYFLIMGGISLLLGTFGSVFSTYSSLYLAKDNDFLLSMPIPVRTIIVSRLLSVYLMGAVYVSAVMLPTLAVYWVMAGPTLARIICGLLLFVIITVIVLMLSVLLGWVVAKISVKLKNRSFITVLIALLFMGAYYFFYFKAREVIEDLVKNAAVYGEKVKAVYPLYLFGRVGEGDWLATAVYAAVSAVLFVLVWLLISRSFIKIATATGAVVKTRYVEKRAKEKSAFRAFLGKEFKRFTSSPNYMLNCGLGIIFIVAAGAALLIFGRVVTSTLDATFLALSGFTPVLLAAGLCMMATMVDTAAPSVSLEGKSIWIPQSLPVDPKVPLRAKTMTQFLLTAVPMLFASVCAAIVVNEAWWVRILLVLSALAYSLFNALFCTFLNLKMPLLDWTSELVPIKQSGAVTVALFANWGIVGAFGALYLLAGLFIGPGLYLGIFTGIFLLLSLILSRWIGRKGAELFKTL